MEFHEYANIFPMMSASELMELRSEMREHGYDKTYPIILYQGKILDGRNRYTAALAEGIEPKYTQFSGESALQFVVRSNVKRRHLDKGQLAVCALEYLPMLEAEARERMTSGINQHSPMEKIPQGEKGTAREHAADMFGVNARYVQDAKTIQKKAPELLQHVRSGKMSIPQAKREIVKRERREAPPLPSDKYRVIYADPPWKYGNSGVINDDNYGHVERHYPPMSIVELCELPIKELADNNAVMFMWVTSPLLEECFDVIKSWGFKYKTHFIWDKVGHNYGHYNSVRHELLLICTRGSCTPDVPKLYDSVQSIEKSKTHSEKPEEFREIIDSLYTHGKRLELFSRTSVDGWEAWGNEPEL